MGCLKGKSLVSIWLVSIGAWIVGAEHASACSCAPPSEDSVASAIQAADVAFEGEVIDAVALGKPCFFETLSSIKHVLSCDRGWQLRVLTPLKGQLGRIVAVYTAANDARCGYRFKKGERLKVVAWYASDKRLSTYLCAMWHANHRI